MKHRPPHHRSRARRLHPAEVLHDVLELSEDERLDQYRRRYDLLADHVERREDLRATAERLTGAATGLLNAPASRIEPVELLTLEVADYWQTRPLPSGRRRLPVISTGGYFATPPATMLHWLDLEEPWILEALDVDNRVKHLPAPDGRRRHRHPPLDLIIAYLVARARHDPIGSTGNPLLYATLRRLVTLAHGGSRSAVVQIAMLASALAPDFRAARPDRRRRHSARHAAIRARLAQQREAVAEEQENFRTFCAGANPTDLPPPLRAHAPSAHVSDSCAPHDVKRGPLRDGKEP